MSANFKGAVLETVAVDAADGDGCNAEGGAEGGGEPPSPSAAPPAVPTAQSSAWALWEPNEVDEATTTEATKPVHDGALPQADALSVTADAVADTAAAYEA